ncbi:MAG: ABC transporter permease, partial [Bacillota bacterium]
MIKLLKCEFMKARRRYVFLTALVITVLGLCWGLYGNYTEVIIKHGWRMFLYQLPLVNAIFLPLLAMVVSSRLCGMEHKGLMLKQLECIISPGKLYDAKLIYGLSIMTVCTLLMWSATVVFGIYKGFEGGFPVKLYLLYLLFTIVPTAVIYIFQHSLALIFKNQAVSFFVGILGEFVGIFSMFLPSIPMLRKSVLWGYYGVLQFVGMFGWSKETRYANVHFDV